VEPVSSKRKSASSPIDAILAQRAQFHRFLATRTGDSAEAEDLLQQSLLKALRRAAQLRRGENAIAWFYRILRTAMADHFRKMAADQRRAARLSAEIQIAGDGHEIPAEWKTAVCACFMQLLPVLKPRYAELIRRIDLQAENKRAVARDLKLKPATLDVVLHRARYALRHRLEVFCGSCSREKCLECFCVRGAEQQV
jgi:RNA polymerase sigma factor (sigma-70 family)